ncbi:MAG: helix-turn-helix domain-containing protein [Halobacteriales archaeon]|nr:helix-turn-helix domain-containing protein [Halobacteriales archaeon]
MKGLAAALLLSAALLCVPAALAATGLDSVGAAVGDAAGVQLPQAPQVAVPAPPHVEVPQVHVPSVDVAVDAKVGLQVGPGGAASPDSSPPTMGTLSSQATFADKAAAVAGEAAGAGALTVLVVAAGSGLDGVRALLARPSARLQQAGRFLLRLLPFVPLFSRIQGSKVLDNPVRAHVHQVVVQDPGLSVEEVRSRAGIAWGTAVHHLRRLEDTGLLVSVTQNARRRYFAANTPASSRRTHVAALTQPTARRVAELVRRRPGLDQTSLCEELGLRNPAASKHLQQLAAHGLVLAQRDGRRCLYHPTEALHAAFGILEGMAVPPAVRATPRPAVVPA